jgi:ATP-dependent exoDNAse (exonuclease V) alpha subunit
LITDELKYRIRETFGHVPTADQERAIQTFALFLSDRLPQCVMVLRGSAGTGKTTLASAIVRAMVAMKQKLVLMAPTGRAAKVFSLYSGQPAGTIHRSIYRQKSAGDLSSFNLNDNLHTDTLFIVDEASMISGVASNDTFGFNSLLDDLIRYIYTSRNCRMLLIGDTAQLPPVGEEEAPALRTGVLEDYGLKVYDSDLSEVLRQSQQSGILWNATQIRTGVLAFGHAGEQTLALPRIRVQGFPDIQVVPGDELIDSLASSYGKVGIDDTIVVTRSNKRANIYNEGIRRTVLDREDELCRGDRLMVVKNNYNSARTLTPSTNSSPSRGGWEGSFSPLSSLPSPLSHPLSGEAGRGLSFIANGDMVVVQRVRNVHELYGFRFAEVTMTFPDYDDCELTAIAMLDTLTTEAPALTREQQEQLYNKVLEEYADIPYKSDRLKKLKEDKYYNALQIKFGYAVTCHKAQGGQWAHVYIDQGYMTDDMLTPDYIHWLYTALTRATECVFLVNWPKTQIDKDDIH